MRLILVIPRILLRERTQRAAIPQAARRNKAQPLQAHQRKTTFQPNPQKVRAAIHPVGRKNKVLLHPIPRQRVLPKVTQPQTRASPINRFRVANEEARSSPPGFFFIEVLSLRRDPPWLVRDVDWRLGAAFWSKGTHLHAARGKESMHRLRQRLFKYGDRRGGQLCDRPFRNQRICDTQ